MLSCYQPTQEDDIASGRGELVLAEETVCILCGEPGPMFTEGGDPWCPCCLVDILPECRTEYADPVVDAVVVDSMLQRAQAGLVRKVAAEMDAEEARR